MLFTTTLNTMTNSRRCTVFSLGASKVDQKMFFLNAWISPTSEALRVKTVYPRELIIKFKVAYNVVSDDFCSDQNSSNQFICVFSREKVFLLIKNVLITHLIYIIDMYIYITYVITYLEVCLYIYIYMYICAYLQVCNDCTCYRREVMTGWIQMPSFRENLQETFPVR